MKKFLSLLLILTILITLSGCSNNEWGYLNLLQNIAEERTFSIAGDYKIETPEKMDISFSGYVDISDTNNLYGYIDFNYHNEEENISVSNGNIILKENKLFLSKNTVRQLLTNTESKEYMEVFDKELSNLNYLYYDLSLGFNEERKEMLNSSKEISKIFSEVLYETFKDFQTSAISKSGNGYTLKLTGENLATVIDEAIEYFKVNKERIYDNVYITINKYYHLLPNSEELLDKESVLKEIENSKEKYLEEADNLIKEYSETKDVFKQRIEEDFAGNFYKNTISKTNTGYKIEEEILYTYEDYTFADPIITETGEIIEVDGMGITEKTFKLKGNLTITPGYEKQISNISNIEPIEVSQTKVDAEYERTYPATKLTITWAEEEYGADLTVFNSIGDERYIYSDITIKDDRIYLPLRQISELFGETVEWDDQNKKAFILRDNSKIDMTGIIVNNRTMIKIRDFEKLGYTVNYEKLDYLNSATIIK